MRQRLFGDRLRFPLERERQRTRPVLRADRLARRPIELARALEQGARRLRVAFVRSELRGLDEPLFANELRDLVVHRESVASRSYPCRRLPTALHSSAARS